MWGVELVAATSDPTVAILVTIVSTVVVMGLLAVVWSLVRTMRVMRTGADDLRRESLDLLTDMRDALGLASGQLERADRLLGAAESISTRVDTASRQVYETLANPVVKVMAFGTGTRTAARRLRRATREG
ncbi:MAG: hypothetical protein ACRDZ8_02625 [Acidimicrobiales bacterium]